MLRYLELVFAVAIRHTPREGLALSYLDCPYKFRCMLLISDLIFQHLANVSIVKVDVGKGFLPDARLVTCPRGAL